MTKAYDVVIIGSGLGGLTAGLYCGRARLKTVIIEKGNLGGAIIDAELIENWPGVEQGISGAELAGNTLSLVMQYAVDLESTVEARGIESAEKDLKKVITGGESYLAKAVIIAGGTRPKKLGIPGEEEFIGKGIYHCVMCDGAPFAGKDIAILGGGDTGISGSLYMARLGSKITLIEATPKLNASMVLQERVKEIPGVQILLSTIAEGIEFEGDVKVLRLKSLETKGQSTLRVEGVFILAGRQPETEYLRGTVELDETGFVKVTQKMETNVPGIFAAGDIRSGSAMQAVAAAGDGATAAISAEMFINARGW
jgi:thioredoxin reductase (NADPH)